MKSESFLSILLLGFIVSCSVGPAYTPPYSQVPDEWKNQNDCCNDPARNSENSWADLEYWWQVFDDGKLNELEELALENNPNLFIAYERIQASRDLMGIAAADFYPQLTLSPLYTNTGELVKNYAKSNLIPGLTTTPFRAHELYYFLPLNLSYEVDLWGKINDRYKAAKYDWMAEEKDFETTMLSLTSSLAFAYYQLRTADKQLDLLQRVLKSRQNSYEINQDRYEGQIAFYSDVALAGEEIGVVLIQIADITRQRKILENQIALLLGIPASDFCLESNPLDGLPPCIPEGLPSEILLRRPDIASARYETLSSHQLVKAAYAAFFPSLILTGTAGFESPIFKQFMEWISRYWMLGAQSNQIVFDGFRTSYQVEYQMARFRQASGEYQQLVVQAFQEVEDSLANLSLYADEYDKGVITVQWAQKAFEIYSDRYLLGLINYIDVVNTERDLLNYQITVNALQGYRFLSTVQLIKALGGGWSCPVD